MEKMSEVVLPHTVTNGGNVILYQIENEYGNQWTNVTAKTPNATGIDYMQLLESSVRSSSIDLPLFHNNPNLRTKAWSKDYDTVGAGGNVDIYTADNYPSCWSCNLAECTSTNGFPPDFTVFDYYTHFQETAPTQPSILAEFQGGSYNPWNGPAGGCVNNTGPNWVNVFYRNNLGNKVTGVNLYMVFGGTTWGGLPMPTVVRQSKRHHPQERSDLSQTLKLTFITRAQATTTAPPSPNHAPSAPNSPKPNSSASSCAPPKT
jgi:beta-galactosidase